MTEATRWGTGFHQWIVSRGDSVSVDALADAIQEHAKCGKDTAKRAAARIIETTA